MKRKTARKNRTNRLIFTCVLLTSFLSFFHESFANTPAGKPTRITNAALVPITGKITSETGEVLSGVTVRVKNSQAGTSTNETGNFSIDAPANATLLISSVGYQSEEIAVGGRSVINITLRASAVSGETVVVVGYGTQRKRDITGAVSRVAGAELARQPVLTPTQALQGKVAGVQIIGSGAPNSAPTVRIRGTGSILAGADPLYVVDGVLTDDIRNINNSDIVSLEVLKDASAASIYGVRAANGVILITTKKGRTGKMIISYDANGGFREVADQVEMANSTQYATYINEASVNTGNGAVLVDPAATSVNTDWYDQILRRGFYQNHNLSISGGTDKINYFLSGGVFTDEGIVIDNKFRRFTLRSNNEYRLSDKFRLGTLISYTNGKTQDVNLGAAYNNAYHAAPIIEGKVGNRYGNTSAYQNVGNPILDIENTDNRYIENRLQGTGFLEFKPISWITLRTSYSTELQFNNRRIYNRQFLNDSLTFTTAGGNQRSPKSGLNVTDERYHRYVWDNTVSAQRTFNKHHITLLAGTTAERIFGSANFGFRSDVPDNEDLWYLNQGDPASQTNGAFGNEKTRISYLGRLNYSYDGRYLLTASFRSDGSSVFKDNYANFPAIGVGWVITKEKFMERQQIFNNLKLRGSYGKIGNDQIPTDARYITVGTGIPYVFNGAVTNTGAAVSGFVDQNIRWENTKEADLGLEFSVLKSRLSGEFDVYDKTVDDALITVNVLGTTGQSGVLTNIATVQNRGIELLLNWNDRIGKDVRYNISVNGSHNDNEVVDLKSGQPLFGGSVGSKGTTTYTANGHPIGSFYILQADGVFHNQKELGEYVNSQGTPITINSQLPTLGDLRYKDLNDDGKINDLDRTFSGSYQPKYTFGATLGVNYKQFDLSMNGYGTAGVEIYNGKKEARFNQKDNVEASVANERWTFENFASNVPRASLDALPHSTYFLESGDFFRINNLTLGYTLQPAILTRARITSLRVYATSQNLATFTNYSGFSPEIQNGDRLGQGIELNAYPTTRTYAVGVNVNF